MRTNLINRLKEEWNNLDPVDPLRGLIANAIDALTQPAQQQDHVIDVRVWHDENHDQNAEFRGVHKLPDGRHVLYKSPPASKPWVGLTVGEATDLWKENALDYAEAIEAKLREKNA